jgi:hypothetical protein
MTPHVERVEEREANLLSVCDITQAGQPVVVVVGCFNSGRRTDIEWSENHDQLQHYCEMIASNGRMGNLLYVAQAHGRLVRWYIYCQGSGMQDLNGDSARLDVIDDVTALDKLLGGLVEQALGMFSH